MKERTKDELYEDVSRALRSAGSMLRMAATAWERVTDIERTILSLENSLTEDERLIASRSIERATETARILRGLRDLHALKDAIEERLERERPDAERLSREPAEDREPAQGRAPAEGRGAP